MAEVDGFYAAAERRIEYIALGLGAAGALCSGIIWGPRTGIGVALGAAFSWVNFRWMKQGVGTLGRLAKAQEGAEKVHVGPGVYFKFIGRYALLFAGAYVILTYFSLPVSSLLAGFAVVIAAALIEVVGQLFRSGSIPRANS
jgi:hypothetical protein